MGRAQTIGSFRFFFTGQHPARSSRRSIVDGWSLVAEFAEGECGGDGAGVAEPCRVQPGEGGGAASA
ncbi:hypothetical protein ACFWY9_37265 [Amycolatopsis sp. NPDC059027]|uniref:hypothetical protein n=1 Tax=Amycolatopsis sp. NPDC059027 TaxID=3346709 RepID=UPI00366A90F9